MTRLLRQFPGENLFREVSAKEFAHDFHPHEMEKMFGKGEDGLVVSLETEIAVYERPGGKLLEARRWPSRSFVRNFGRIVRMLFTGVSETVLDIAGTPYHTAMYKNNFGQAALTPDPFQQELAGAALAIGNGVPDEDSGRRCMVSPVAYQTVKNSVYTTTENAVTLAFSITDGLTVNNALGETITEVGLFAQFQSQGESNPAQRGIATLMAYDGVTPLVVSHGGVVVPKYSMAFAA